MMQLIFLELPRFTDASLPNIHNFFLINASISNYMLKLVKK